MITLREARTLVEDRLHRWGIRNRAAFTALLISGIMAVMIGSVLLVVSYVVVNAVVYTITSQTQTGALGPVPAGGCGYLLNGSTGCLNASFTATINTIVQALGIIGISLVVTGIAIIVYVLIGLGGVGGGMTQR